MVDFVEHVCSYAQYRMSCTLQLLDLVSYSLIANFGLFIRTNNRPCQQMKASAAKFLFSLPSSLPGKEPLA